MSFTKFFALSMFSMLVWAADNAPRVKMVTIKDVSPVSGEQMFHEYCAVCHGADARGHGPAAAAMKVAPTDLPALSQNNRGKYPGMRVFSVIHGDSNYPAHGSNDMPVWGPLFRSMGSNMEVTERITNLCSYIETLQNK